MDGLFYLFQGHQPDPTEGMCVRRRTRLSRKFTVSAAICPLGPPCRSTRMTTTEITSVALSLPKEGSLQQSVERLLR